MGANYQIVNYLLVCIFLALAAFPSRPRGVTGARQADSTWGLARVSHLGDSYDPEGPFEYLYENRVTDEVTVYIIDTGITPTHEDFGNRARVGKSFVQGETPCDQHGHGTHVAGTVGGTEWGACKSCILVGVKVLSGAGMGSNQAVVDGIRWSADNCSDTSRCVINMSLGGGQNDDVDDAVQYAFERGVPVIVAAGNDGEDACTVSPAGSPNAYTVAASNITNGFASFSNHGSCVETIAPGVKVTSAWVSGSSAFNCYNGGTETATRTISGTSMASPHVAGVAAYLRSTGRGKESAQQMYNLLDELEQRNQIRGVPNENTVNELTFNGYSE